MFGSEFVNLFTKAQSFNQEFPPFPSTTSQLIGFCLRTTFNNVKSQCLKFNFQFFVKITTITPSTQLFTLSTTCLSPQSSRSFPLTTRFPH